MSPPANRQLSNAAPDVVLQVRDLKVHFPTPDGIVKAVDGVSFELRRGETLGIVGESGCGKSTVNLAVLRLLSHPRAIVSGEVIFRGRNLLTASRQEMQRTRGSDIAMIFQDPFASLHPMYRVGNQLVEAMRLHTDVSRRKAIAHVADVLGAVGIAQPARRLNDFPHEFSGGMRQRVMIAMALVNDPEILIADEPTTALDVSIQTQILQLMQKAKSEFNLSVILVTHDLGVIKEVAQRVIVMYAGRVAERASTRDIFVRPMHPYSWGLLGSIPKLERKSRRLVPIEGTPPSLIHLPDACCPFHSRCAHRFERCPNERPPLVEHGGGHADACLLPTDRKDALRPTREVVR